MKLVLLPLAASGICIVGHLIALWLFPRLGLLDFPKRYGLKRAPLPYPTGVIAALTFFILFILTQTVDKQVVGVLIAGAIILVSSFIDDRKELPSYVRLGLQIAAAICIYLSGSCMGGRICSITNPLAGVLGGPDLDMNLGVSIISISVTVGWLILTTNALNWFDGIPGQVSLLSVIGFLTIGFLSLSGRVGQPELAVLAFILAGIALACLLFDFPPPKVVMGDTGAMFFGLMLGTLTIYAGGKVATAFLVFGVPLIDSIIVIVRRVYQGKSPFTGGKDHLHHLLLKRGWPPQAIVLLTATIGSVFGITALFMSTIEKMLAAIVLTIIMVIITVYASKES